MFQLPITCIAAQVHKQLEMWGEKQQGCCPGCTAALNISS
jgi:hypothetical protein